MNADRGWWYSVPARMLVEGLLLLAAGCPSFYANSPRFHRRAAVEKPPVKAGTDLRQGRLAWPVVGTIVQGYGVRVDPVYATKTNSLGIDIVCASGAPVKATEAGQVSFADRFMGYGKMVIVDHGNRLHSLYSRLSDIKVTVGSKVARGEIIGFASDTLHFEVRKEGRAVDPEQWLGSR
ncbi:MAG: peptidoglycan DD-metalloendopeptidase family protein [candidate division WOR-3 bacterium]